jgi:hypothetical protein
LDDLPVAANSDVFEVVRELLLVKGALREVFADFADPSARSS